MKDVSFFKITLLILFLFFTVAGIFFTKPFLAPLSFAIILSLLMMPVAEKIESAGLPRAVGILLSALIILVLMAFLLILLYEQVERFVNDLPGLKNQILDKLERLQQQISDKMDISSERQQTYMRSNYGAFIETAAARVKTVVAFTTGLLGSFFLTLVYMSFFMHYSGRFKNFFAKIFPDADGKTEHVIEKISEVARQYLVGKLLMILFLTAIYLAGFLILGLKHAVFLAILSGILSIIPIIGTLVGAFFTLLMALVTNDSFGVAGVVVGIYVLAELAENYILTPWLLGSRVNLNSLFTLMAVMAGGLLWDVSGMVLAIPFSAILKIVFDNITPLKPLGYLIGKEERPPSKLLKRIKGEGGN